MMNPRDIFRRLAKGRRKNRLPSRIFALGWKAWRKAIREDVYRSGR